MPFPADLDGVTHHHRILFRRIQNAEWVLGSPEGRIGVRDLAAHPGGVVPWPRNSGPPGNLAPAVVNAFDELVDLDAMRRMAGAYADIMGAAVAEGNETAEWRVADTANEAFGEVVPAEALGDDEHFVRRGTSALAQINGVWVAVEAVTPVKEVAWRQMKCTGPGRDCRLLAEHKDSDSKRTMTLDDILLVLEKKTEKHWPLTGPPALKEFLTRVKASSRTLSAHQAKWLAKSGMHGKSSLGREHGFLLEVLEMAMSYDQLNGMNIAALEVLARRIVQIEIAVRRSPKSPDFEGLDVMLERGEDDTGGMNLPDFFNWLSSKQKDEAMIMKQFRLFREEQAAASKGKPPVPPKT